MLFLVLVFSTNKVFMKYCDTNDIYGLVRLTNAHVRAEAAALSRRPRRLRLHIVVRRRRSSAPRLPPSATALSRRLRVTVRRRRSSVPRLPPSATALSRRLRVTVRRRRSSAPRPPPPPADDHERERGRVRDRGRVYDRDGKNLCAFEKASSSLLLAEFFSFI
uniref:Uncharacterized protein n=1 Tax=Oryza sativa subsp. japonica TaxID=39947 RepID=Q5ZA09_ORYSJ|nr:hypothetical protein [Oryza sativa Japonica Group]BAD61601.1 hypothetical protein [Oryza sativa Japonica Group]